MKLWRVDMCGVSYRFVEAGTKAQAEEAARQALLDGMYVRATDAGASLTRAYDGAGPLQRKKMLAMLDGLTNPRERQSSRSARRRLEREVRREEAWAEWIVGAIRGAPPVSQDVIDLLVRQGEVRHIEVSHLRLHEWERKRLIHGETL